MTDALLSAAARLLEREAAILARSYRNFRGLWVSPGDSDPKADHDEMLEIARLLRVRAGEAG